MREYHYRVDRDGRVFHDGTEIIDPLVLRFFVKAMRRAPDGRFLVLCQGEHNWFEAEDTPLVVQRLATALEAGRLQAVELVFAGECRERLDPGTLESRDGHVFCRVRGALPARFGRVAVQQLAPFLAGGADSPALVIAGVRFPIREAAPVRA